jgi:hypothetical protein
MNVNLVQMSARIDSSLRYCCCKIIIANKPVSHP